MEGHNKPATPSSAAVYPHGATRSRPNSHDNDQRLFSDSVIKFLAILSLAAIVGFVVLLLILLMMPDPYEPELPEFHVDSFSVSNLTSTNGSGVSFLAEVRLTARNPSGKVPISYDHIVAGMYYKFMLLSQASLAPFSHGGQNKTSLVAKLAADGNFVEKWVGDAINGDIGQNGRVEFDFKLASWAHWESIRRWWGSRYVLQVFCGDLTVAIPSNGRSGGLIGPPGHCQVRKGADDNDIRFSNNLA